MNKAFEENSLYELSQFVGDYSQNVCGSSYNEDEVRCIWKAGELNDRATHPCYTLDSTWPDRPQDYQAEMKRLVKAAGVWPLSWRSKPGHLTYEEKATVGLAWTCHGDVLCFLIKNYARGSAYNEQLITEFFYDFWKKFQESKAKLSANAFCIQLTEHVDFLELQKKFEVPAKRLVQTKAVSQITSTGELTLTFTEVYPSTGRSFMEEWLSYCAKHQG